MQPRPYFNLSEALSFAWKTTLDNWSFLVPVTLVYLFAAGIPSGLSNAVSSEPAVQFFGLLISIAIALYIYGGLVRVNLAYVDGLTPSWSMLWMTPFNRLATMFTALLLAGIVTEVGFIFLIIPGIYLHLRFSQVKFLVFDKNLSTIESLGQSGVLTQGVKLPLFGFSIVSILILFVGFLCLGFGVLVALPVVMLAEAMVYRQLSNSLVIPKEPSVGLAPEVLSTEPLREPLPSIMPLMPEQTPIPQPMSPPPGWQQAEVSPEPPQPPTA